MNAMKIDYVHARNRHTIEGPAAAFPKIVPYLPQAARSVVDVGCGTGVWLRAALENGIPEVLGVDGVAVPSGQLVVPGALVRQHDLTVPLELGRRFDVALCLEVAEHLDPAHATVLIGSLVGLADTVVFSAASPGQNGQHHVNCQWPQYWQALFNRHAYSCDDAVRWAIWDDSAIEPWYRQNMFIARRNPAIAGSEPRIAAVRHPELREDETEIIAAEIDRIAAGGLPMGWYPRALVGALMGKLSRAWRPRGRTAERRDASGGNGHG